MSDQVKIKIKSKGIKARLPDSMESGGYSDFNEAEENFKREMENQYKIGFEDGYTTAQNELEMRFTEELVQKSQDFYNILSNLDQKFLEYEETFYKMVLATSKKISEKILQKEINIESCLENNLSIALKKVVGANNITVKLSPKEFDNVIDDENKFMILKEFNKLKIEKDNSVMPGGCVIETDVGNIDARISSQVNEIIKQIELQILENE